MKQHSILNRFILHITLLFFAGFGYAQEGNDLYEHRLNENKWDELRDGIREAVACHFDEGQAPKIIRLHIVREEMLQP